MSDRATEEALLNRFLADECPPCPGCKQKIDVAAVGECPACGEVLTLEVRSLRQARSSDPGAIPVGMATFTASAIAFLSLLAAGMIWSRYQTLRGIGLPMPPEYRREAFGAAAMAAAWTGVAVTMWLKKKALLRARLRVRIGVLAATLAAAGMCIVGLWLAGRP